MAFVQHPDNAKEIEIGVSHAGSPGGAVSGGTMQHVAFHVDTIDDLYAMRDRIRSRGLQVMGPIDHGFVQSIYFAGPEGLSLEVSTGSDIDERAWIDPEVTGLCGITDAELEALKNPAIYQRPAEPVPQPPFEDAPFHMHPPEQWRKKMAVPGRRDVGAGLGDHAPGPGRLARHHPRRAGWSALVEALVHVVQPPGQVSGQVLGQRGVVVQDLVEPVGRDRQQGDVTGRGHGGAGRAVARTAAARRSSHRPRSGPPRHRRP